MVAHKPHKITFRTADPKSLSDFFAVPRFKALLDSDKCHAIETPTRVPKTTTEDAFVSKTLATEGTIRAWETFYVGSDSIPAADKSIAQLYILVSLGGELDGHCGIVHGGFISVLMDEAMTLLAHFHNSPGTTCFTASLQVDYKKPVPTPNSYLCKVWLENRSSGRKLWIKATLENADYEMLAAGQTLVLETPLGSVAKI